MVTKEHPYKDGLTQLDTSSVQHMQIRMVRIDKKSNDHLKIFFFKTTKIFEKSLFILISPFAKEEGFNTHMHYIIQTVENILPGLFRLHTCLCLMLFQSLKKKKRKAEFRSWQ